MKGTELSEKQLKAAEQFILSLTDGTETSLDDPTLMISQRWDSLVRLVAFYGAIRAYAVTRGGTVEDPCETFKTERELKSA